MKIRVILNPNSGKGKAREYLPEIEKAFKRGNDIEVYLTKNKSETVEYVKNNCNDCDMLIVLGGDGTMNEVVNGYVAAGSKTPVGYIPTGSTNDFAVSHGLTKDAAEACRRFAAMNTRSVDVGEFNGQYFIYVAASGAFSQTSYETPAELKQAFGHFAYVLDGAASLADINATHIKITADGEDIEDDFLVCMVANSKTAGGAVMFDNSDDDLCDGKFELLLVRNPDDLVELGATLADLIDRSYDGERIICVSASTFRITSTTDIAWSLDGEYGGSGREADVRVKKGALTLLV